MSFLKVTDPSKRDFIVEQFLKSKKNIKQKFLAERLGDIGLQRKLTKMFKQIVNSQSTISKEQKALLSTIIENSAEPSFALKALPASISASLKAIKLPQYPSIEAYEEDSVSDIKTLELGDIATKFLQQYVSDKRTVDTTISLPVELANIKAIVNMKNDDNECFKWCITRALNPTNNHDERITNELIEQSEKHDWGDIEFPVAADASVITKFERKNVNVNINVFGYGNQIIFPI